MKTHAVSFDCWNTLIYEDSWETAHALRVGALEQAATEAGRALEAGEAGQAFDAAWHRHMELWEQGVASGATEVAHWALAALDLSPHGRVLPDLVKHFEEASHSGRVVALDGAGETLEALARAGIRRALVCDTGLTPGRVVRQQLDRLGLLSLLEETIFSDEWSLPKPHPEVFHAALAPLGAEPHESVHVGDLRRTDVAGGRGVGMTTIRLRARYDDQSAHPDADHVADSHAEVREILLSEASG
jgi:putative hydrolase of the HAD superfamily